jgi:hypothetical protein
MMAAINGSVSVYIAVLLPGITVLTFAGKK